MLLHSIKNRTVHCVVDFLNGQGIYGLPNSSAYDQMEEVEREANAPQKRIIGLLEESSF